MSLSRLLFLSALLTFSARAAPDLIIADVRINSQSQQQGSVSFNWTATISNNGDSPAELRNVSLQTFLVPAGGGTPIPASGWSLATTPTALNARASLQRTFSSHTGLVPDQTNVLLRYPYLRLIVDYGGQVAESNENNNTRDVLVGPALAPVSPVWKRLYAVPDSALQADSDGDGLAGWQEAAFGSDPFDRLSAPRPALRRSGTGAFLDWTAKRGAREQVFASSNLLTWTPFGAEHAGTGGITSIVLDPLGSAKFFRIQALPPYDWDQDGLSGLEEGLLGSDDSKADTDDDTFQDKDEWTRGWNPARPELNRFWRERNAIAQVDTLADPDGDGFENRAESMFGTDPKSRTSAPGITIVPGAGATVLLRWATVRGIRYQLQAGDGLGAWASFGDPVLGTGQTHEIIVTAATLGDSRFFRLAALTPADADGDTLDDYEEGLFSTDRLLADTDRDGASDATEILTLRTDPLRGVQLPEFTAPAASTSSASIAITGSAAAGETIMASGGTADVSATAAATGAFTLNVPLQTNRLNRITLSARNAAGQTGPSHTVEVLHDSQPPDVFIDFPGHNAQVYTATATIAGRVADALSGFQGLDVTVNGQTANVVIGIGTNGTFERTAVPLVIGENQITATARDSLGNTTTKTVLVYRADPAGAASITAISGDGLSGPVHQVLPVPVEIEVRTAAGASSPGQPVTFKVIRSDGRLTASSGDFGGGLTHQTVTGANGRARVFWRLGSDAGCGNNRIEVTATGIPGAAYFCASGHPGPAAQINIGSGSNQVIESGGLAHEPLRAWVSDGCNGIAGVPVTFTVTGGGGKVNGQTSVTVPTTTTGHAAVSFQLGPFTGNHTVEANYPGHTGSPAVFTARGLERQPDQPTSFTGIVQDNAGQPIGGARAFMRIGGQWGNMVTTAPDGTFTMPDLGASGQMKLLVSGAEATQLGGQSIPGGTFPSLEFDLVAVPNTSNSLTGPVLLPRLDPANRVLWDGTHDIALTCKGIEGLQFIVRAGSMTKADGTKPTPANPAFLSINQVHHDDVPMPMPDGASPPFAWTFQPGGATFSPPVEIRYPNMSGLAPGTVAYFLTYDHAVEQFRIISSGHVTADGSQVITDPGSGLTLSGWGCNCPPYSVTGACSNECEDDPEVKQRMDQLRAARDAALTDAKRYFREGLEEATKLFGRPDGISFPFKDLRNNFLLCSTTIRPAVSSLGRLAASARYAIPICIAALADPLPGDEVVCALGVIVILKQMRESVLTLSVALPSCKAVADDLRKALQGVDAVVKFKLALDRITEAAARQDAMFALCPALALDPATQQAIDALKSQIREKLTEVEKLTTEAQAMLQEIQALIARAEKVLRFGRDLIRELQELVDKVKDVLDWVGGIIAVAPRAKPDFEIADLGTEHPLSPTAAHHRKGLSEVAAGI